MLYESWGISSLFKYLSPEQSDVMFLGVLSTIGAVSLVPINIFRYSCPMCGGYPFLKKKKKKTGGALI